MEGSKSDWTIDNDFIQSFHLYGWRYDDMYPQGDAPTTEQILCQFEDGEKLKALKKNLKRVVTIDLLAQILIPNGIRSLRFFYPEPFLNVGNSFWLLGHLRATFLNVGEEKCRLLTDLMQEWVSFHDLVVGETFNGLKSQLSNALVEKFLEHREEVFREHNMLINLSVPEHQHRFRQEKVKQEQEAKREEDESSALLACYSKKLEVEAKERQRNRMERIFKAREQKIRSDIDKKSSQREKDYRKSLQKQSLSREQNFRKNIEEKLAALKHELNERLEEKRRVREGENDEVLQERSKHLEAEISPGIEKSSQMKQRVMRNEYVVKWERSKEAMTREAEESKGNQKKILEEQLEKMLAFRRQVEEEKLDRILTLRREELRKEQERRKNELRDDLRRRMEETLESRTTQIMFELEQKYSSQFQELGETRENPEDGEIILEHPETAARQQDPASTYEFTYRPIRELKSETATAVRRLLALKEELRFLELSKTTALCVSCMRNIRNVVIQECMHLHFCSDCFKNQYQRTGKCPWPTCNNIITGVLIRELLL